MRSVTITGKHNIDQMNKVDNKLYKSVRTHMTTLDETVMTHAYQMDMLRNLYVIGTDYIAENKSLF